MLRWFLVGFLFCTSCRSATAKNEVAAKPTPSASEEKPPLELFSLVAYSPRRIAEVDAGISLNPQIQKCFHSLGAGKPTTVTISGKILYSGELEGGRVGGHEGPLKNCLMDALKTVQLGRGRIGPFKMQLSTDRGSNPGGKSLILDSGEIKKFE